MSIVEKALSKTKARLAGEEGNERPSPVQAAPSVSRAPEPMQPPAMLSTRTRVTLDFEAMRAAGMLPPEELTHRYADEFRRIKWPLLAAAFGQGAAPVDLGHLVLVTSAVPGEGKSFISMNLALNIASPTTPVLLIDADSAKAKISRLCRLQPSPGFIDLLSDEALTLADVVVDTNVAGLQILPAGRTSTQSAELFAGRRAAQMINEISRYRGDRIVIIDSAPLLATNEAQVLSRQIGQVVMVVRGEHTPSRAVTDAVALLDRRRLIRCVINQVRAGALGDSYRQYYYAYYDERR